MDLSVIDLLLNIVRPFVLSIILFYGLFQLFRYRYQSLIYLTLSVAFLLLSEVASSVVRPFLAGSSLTPVIVDAVPHAMVVLSMMGTLYFLSLSFDSFKTEKVLSSLNVVITVAFVFVAGNLTTLTVVVYRLFSSLPETATFGVAASLTQDPTQPSVESGPHTFVYQLLSVLVVVSFFLVILLAVKLVYGVISRHKELKNPLLLKGFKISYYAVVLVLLGVLQNIAYSTEAGNLFSIAGFLLLVYSYQRYGKFFLQGEDIQRMVILDRAGLTIYGFDFQSAKRELPAGDLSPENQDILFSGAFQAISTLIGEFLGNAHLSIREIVLDQNIFIIKTFQHKEQVVSIILVTTRSTRFFRDALESFQRNFQELFGDRGDLMNFTSGELKMTNALLQEAFGFHYYD